MPAIAREPAARCLMEQFQTAASVVEWAEFVAGAGVMPASSSLRHRLLLPRSFSFSSVGPLGARRPAARRVGLFMPVPAAFVADARGFSRSVYYYTAVLAVLIPIRLS